MSLFGKSMSYLLLILAILLNFSCSKKTDLQKLSLIQYQLKSEQNYNSYLALEYLLFAKNLELTNYKQQSKFFAKKGLLVANNKRIIPESPIKWGADTAQIEAMIIMQKRLEEILKYPHIKYYLPIQTAHLTYLYDCWISIESKKIFRGSEIAKCRIRFSRLIDEIEDYIENLSKDHTKKVKITSPSFNHFKVSFDLNSYQINSFAAQEIIKTLEFIEKTNGDYIILIVGNTDRSGKKIYNQS